MLEALLDTPYDFVVDAIDTLAPKTALLVACVRRKMRVISSMGAGARLDPAAVAYADIADTYHCGLAREVRRRLRAEGIRRGVRVVFSTEQPVGFGRAFGRGQRETNVRSLGRFRYCRQFSGLLLGRL